MHDINTIINRKFIISLKPCRFILNNYDKFYKYKKFTLEKFLNLRKITWKHKIWVLFNCNFLTDEEKKHLAIYFAERILHLVEKQYSYIITPRLLLERIKNNDINQDQFNAYLNDIKRFAYKIDEIDEIDDTHKANNQYLFSLHEIFPVIFLLNNYITHSFVTASYRVAEIMAFYTTKNHNNTDSYEKEYEKEIKSQVIYILNLIKNRG